MQDARHGAWPRPVLEFLACWLPAVGLMGLIFLLSAQSSLGGPGEPGTLLNHLVAKAAHVGVYATLTWLLWRALHRTLRVARGRRPAGRVAFTAFALAALYGLGDELHQAFVPGREANLLDVGLDAGAALAMVCWLAWVRGRKG